MARNARTTTRKRLEPDVRAQMILDEAVRFFAEHGFAAQITDLATRLGISHALIFRYFGSKRNLIDQVYRRVYSEHWSDQWVKDLADRSVPLKRRIENFYESYFDEVDNPEWIRVALFAGLAGEHLPRGREVQGKVDQFLTMLIDELRAFKNVPADAPEDPLDYELAFHLHSTMVYLLVRKYVINRQPSVDRSSIVRRVIDNFFCEFEHDRAKAARAKPVKAAQKRALPASPSRRKRR